MLKRIWNMLINHGPLIYFVAQVSHYYHKRVATILAVWYQLEEFNSKGASCGTSNKILSSINAFDLGSDFYAIFSMNNVILSCMVNSYIELSMQFLHLQVDSDNTVPRVLQMVLNEINLNANYTSLAPSKIYTNMCTF